MTGKLIPPLIILCLVLFSLRSGTIEAQSSEVQVLLATQTPNLNIGGVVPLDLIVTYPNNYQVLFPRLPVDWGDVEILRQHPPSISANPDGMNTATQRIDVTVFSLGSFETPEFNVTVRNPSGLLVDEPVPQIMLEVLPALPEGDVALRDIRPQEAINLTEIWPVAAAALGVVVFTSLLIFGLVKLVAVLKARAARQVDERTPYEVARDELMAIELQPEGVDDSMVRNQYAQVAVGIRRFLEQAYNIPAFDQTTQELRGSLQDTSVNSENYQALIDLLAECDLAKFSQVIPESDPEQHIVTRTMRMIDELTPMTTWSGRNGAEVTGVQSR